MIKYNTISLRICREFIVVHFQMNLLYFIRCAGSFRFQGGRKCDKVQIFIIFLLARVELLCRVKGFSDAE